MQLSILKARSEDSFGLDYVTVYNWGTYDKNPDTIKPELQHSWITGENRAGKSTVLDAVVTLLTPNRKRLYNAASGSEKSSERNEKSYIKGAYNQGEEGAVKYLRPDEGDYSVLIGCFRTKNSNRVICLAQVLWLHDEKVSKFFVVSQKALTIDEFKGASNISLLKKQLKAIDPTAVKVYDQFNDYSHAYMKLFGMRSGKALELFGVAVSLRDLDNLGAFIRNSMLDRLDVSAQINTVIELHRNSAETYKNILKAKDQIEILKPLPESWETYKKCVQEIADRDVQLAILKPYLSYQYIDVCDLKNKEHETAKLDYELKGNVLTQKKNQVEDKIESLEVALSQDKGANQIEKLEIEIEALKSKREIQIKSAELFNEDALVLDLSGCEDEISYTETIHGAGALHSQLPVECELVEGDLNNANLQCSKKAEELNSLKSELDSLGKRDSNIPDYYASVRSRVAEALGLTNNDLPFLGELVEVKKIEHEWEGALERLLHASALNVLVEEKHYSIVTTYVKQNNLRGKLSFMKVDSKSVIKVRPERDDNLFAFSKIAIKECNLSPWIERHLRKIADHLCCDSAQEVMASNRGITKEGFIRNDSERHVKDDRSNVNDRTKFILGWDTKLKRDAVVERIQEIASEFSVLQKLASEHKIKLDELNKKVAAARSISRYKSFDEVAHHLTASQIATKEDSLKILEEKNKNAKLLRSQLVLAKDQLTEFEKQIKDVERQINTIQVYIDEINKSILQYRTSYETVTTDEITKMFPLLDQVRTDLRLDLYKELFADAFNAINEKLRKLKDSKTAERDRVSKIATGCMSKFRDKWDDECYDLDPSIQHADEFLEKYNSLKNEDLPKYEAGFREMFTKKGLNAVTILDQTMREKVDEIRDSIELINKPLKNTLYSPTTKISLLCKDIENSRSVADFQARIRKCLSRTTEDFDSERQIEAFQAVNELVEYLTAKETETDRDRALDVRNWLEFYAVETNVETEKIENYYWSSGGGSGGQKTKLTLTILASAMAYQFGLTEDAVSSDSFNFVMLDEAFARMDQKNSELVLSIFKEVGFQIMVASPPMYGFLVEPHIDCFHFASINEEKSKSRIYTATRLQTEEILGRKLHSKKNSEGVRSIEFESV
jgi:uncharacterized protein YPO0396